MSILGIDLGTTNSACGIWKDGAVQLIPNRLGDILTPSVVGVDKSGSVTVGKTAKEHLVSKPDQTVAAFKRMMGTTHPIQLGKQKFTATEISSLVLKSLKEDAEAHLGQAVDEAIISVPAYFNDNQRHATKQAAELAGLKVQRLINEPTAAALAYGLQEKEEGTIIVLDMGGGTFDVSILEYFEGIMEVHASAGDNFLGGEDFTEVLAKDFMLKKEIDEAKLTKNLREELWRKADGVKMAVNKGQEATLELVSEDVSHSEAYTPDSFNKLVFPLLTRVKQPIEKALRDAKISPKDLDDVILVGGATRMGVLRNAIGKMFGRIPTCNLDPDQVVAMGAAIQAGLKEKNVDLDDIVLTDVCPYSLGTEILNPIDKNQAGYFLPIIERNRTVPVSVVESLVTVQNNQTDLEVSIFQGESRQVSKNIFLGKLMVKVPKNKAGEETIDVRYSYDMNGLLEVDVTVNSTGKKYYKSIEQAPGALTEKDKEKARARLAKLKFHPRDQEENRVLLAKGEALYEASMGQERQEIGYIMAQFEQILNKQNQTEIAKARVEMAEALKHFETDLWT